MILLTLLFGASVVLGAVDYTGHKVLRATPTTEYQLKWLLNLQDVDFWKDPTTVNRPADFRISPDRVKTLQMSMTYLRMRHEVLHDNVQDLVDRSLARNPQRSGLEDFDEYKTYAEIETYLATTVAACGARCTLTNFPAASYEGRDLWVVKITDGLGGSKRNVWVDSGIHAREWLAFSTGLFFIDRLVYDFGSDPEVDDILSSHDVYIMPAINADGYVYSWTDDRMWRKSRQPYGGCTGTDINRNFDFMWMTIGASDQPCSNTFAGPNPWSEPEAAVVRDQIVSQPGTWDVFMTLHTHGQLWMAPFGYTDVPPPDYDELMRVANIGADALTAVHGTPYTTGSASEILYFSSGTSRDWARGDASTGTQIPYVYTLELRDLDSFVLPASEILPTGEETWAGFKAMMMAIKNP